MNGDRIRKAVVLDFGMKRDSNACVKIHASKRRKVEIVSYTEVYKTYIYI